MSEDDQLKLVNGEPEFRAPQPPGDTVTKFRQIVEDYRTGWVKIPEHQRNTDAWPAKKKKDYIQRLKKARNGSMPPGSFATYQLVRPGETTSPIYLNDGLQRLTTLRELQADPAAFETDTDGVRDLLQQTITVQHRHYATHDEAMTDFQLINNGTMLTPWELCRGFLRYMSGFEERWEGLFEDVDKAIRASESRLRTTSSRNRQERENEHKRRRHTLALFHRFLTGEKRHNRYPDVAKKQVQAAAEKREVVELRVRDVLEEKGYEESRRVQRQFTGFIESETATLEDAIRQCLGAGAGLNPVSHRWLLDLGVWRRNNEISIEQHRQFLFAFLKNTRGSAQWIRVGEDGKRNIVTVGLGHLGTLPRLAEFAGMPDFVKVKPRRKGQLTLPGYDNSHVTPFVSDGDGPTFPEPASVNRSRGARPVVPAADRLAS